MQKDNADRSSVMEQHHHADGTPVGKSILKVTELILTFVFNENDSRKIATFVVIKGQCQNLLIISLSHDPGAEPGLCCLRSWDQCFKNPMGLFGS